MALDVRFLKGTQAEYDALVTKEAKTFYYTTDTQELYLGSEHLSVTEAEELPYDNTTSGLEADDVQAAIDELDTAIDNLETSSAVTISKTTGTAQDSFSARYTISQGGVSLSPTIDIAKDMVISSGSVAHITFSNDKLWDGQDDVTEIIKGAGVTPTAADAGAYLKLIIANATSDKIYIAAEEFVDSYVNEDGTAQGDDVSEVVVRVNNTTNRIGASLADGGVTTAKIADDAVTASKISIDAETKYNNISQEAGADGLLISVTTTDGQVSAVTGSIAADTYDAYGAAATAKTESIEYTEECLTWGDINPSSGS